MKKALPLLVLLAVIAGAVIFVTARGDDDSAMNQSEESSNQPSQSSDPDAAHLKGSNAGATVDATGQTAVTVTMSDFKFDPQVLKIKKGTTVTWQNDGAAGHDVKPAENSPQEFEGSELLSKGEKYSFTFNETGKYYYLCSPHASQMRAIVEVVE